MFQASSFFDISIPDIWQRNPSFENGGEVIAE